MGNHELFLKLLSRNDTGHFCFSLAKASDMAMPNINMVGKYNPSTGLEMGKPNVFCDQQ